MSATPMKWLAITALATVLVGSAQAQDYPARPIQVIVPFAGGSASDVVTRIMLDRMAKSLGQPFIVDNRPGAGGNTGTQAAARTAPDGYTLVMSTVGPLAANRTLFKSLGYDPEKDFTPISLFAILPNVVVINSKLPPKTLSEFKFQFSLRQVLITMAVAAVMLASLSIFGAKALTIALGVVALAGIAIQTFGLFDPPPIVVLGWWILLLMYLGLGLMTAFFPNLLQSGTP